MRLKKVFLNSYKKMTFVEITHGQKDTESLVGRCTVKQLSTFSRSIITDVLFCPVLSDCFSQLSSLIVKGMNISIFFFSSYTQSVF